MSEKSSISINLKFEVGKNVDRVSEQTSVSQIERVV